MLPLIDDFHTLALEKRPLIDVRAPVEFNQGSFPHAVNLPLLDDEERRLVGICYKEKGNDEAVKLGHKLVSGANKAKRLAAWSDFITQHPKSFLYCFRGGQRSQITQSWLAQEGIVIPRLKGGYKAFRNYLIKESLNITKNRPTLILGGRTGSGKTLLLKKLHNSIDLEALANHRGSSFGRFITPQPTQIDFENALAYALIDYEQRTKKPLIIEHESHNIGRIYIPKKLYENFLQGELVLLETPLETRIAITFDEYVTKAQNSYEESYAEEGLTRWKEAMLESFRRIKKRLGSQRFHALTALFELALQAQHKDHSPLAHKSWIKELLVEYYDPMYDYQIKKSPLPVRFKGDADAVLDFFNRYQSSV